MLVGTVPMGVCVAMIKHGERMTVKGRVSQPGSTMLRSPLLVICELYDAVVERMLELPQSRN